MIYGPEAIDNLALQHPEAYKSFGDHQSMRHFMLAISRVRWSVMQVGDCWMFIEDIGASVGDLHWCCPHGADIESVRTMLTHAFDRLGFAVLTGETPDDTPYAKAARVLSRAVGATKHDGIYVLTKRRFQAYNAQRLERVRGT